MRQLLAILLSLLSMSAIAQQKNVAGFVSDAKDGERLLGASVVVDGTTRGVITDNNGYFSLKAQGGETLCVRFIGYEDLFITLTGNEKILHIKLRPVATMLESVEVKADRIERKQFNTITLTAKNTDNIPSIGSRADIIKAAQQQPGIEPMSEGSSLMLVRGGNPGENLYQLDNIPLIYVNHLGGFMSVFNPVMINSMDIYKGGFPARFGNKLSSVVDLTQKKGDPTMLQGTASIGITDLSFSLEGPGGLKNSSFIFTGRKTLFDVLLYAASEISKNNGGQDNNFFYGFHDFNAKYSWAPDDKNVFAFNAYVGDDYIRIWKDIDKIYTKENNIKNNIWGNILVAGSWNHVFGPRLYAGNIISFTRYRLSNHNKYYNYDGYDTIDFFNKSTASVSDLSIRSQWKYSISENWVLEYGVQSSLLFYEPNYYYNSLDDIHAPHHRNIVNDNSAYLDNVIKVGKIMEGSIGLRINNYNISSYSHHSLEPRLNISFNAGKIGSFNLSAMRVTQNAHLLMTNGDIFSNEVWIPADEDFVPSSSEQMSAGWRNDFYKGLLYFEANAYYKKLENLVIYSEGFNCLLGDDSWRSKVESGGQGTSYGVELLLRKTQGKFNGHIGYTYSHTTRQFDNINNGTPFVYDYDRPHSINININYEYNEKWSFSALWTYHTGLPYTPMIGIQYVPTIDPVTNETEYEQILYYADRNSDRMRDYHRLDLAAKWNTTTEKGRKAEWTFSIYNVYCRHNTSYYYYGDNQGNPITNQTIPNQKPYLWSRSFFPIIPSFSYKVWF